MVKNTPANAEDVRDMGSIPESGRSPAEGHGNPLQYSCLQNPRVRRLVGYSPQGHKEFLIFLKDPKQTSKRFIL